MPSVDSGSTARLRRLAAGITVAGMSLLLAGAEAVLRARTDFASQARGRRDTLALAQWARGPCYVSRDGGLTRVDPGNAALATLRPGAAPRVPLHPAPGMTRLVVVGESSAVQLESMLEAAAEAQTGDRRFEVLRCAVPGGTLEDTRQRLAHALTLAPSVVVLYFGHNLRFHRPAPALGETLEAWRTHSALLDALASRLVRPPAPEAPSTPDDLERFVADAARRVHGAGARLLVGLPAGNLWFAPSDPSPAHEGRVRAWLAWARRTPGSTAPQDPGRATASWAHDEGLRALGDEDLGRARTWLAHARDHDPMPTRAAPDVTAALLGGAAATPDTRTFDAVAACDRLAPEDVLGWRCFADNVHPSLPLLRALSREVVRASAGDLAATAVDALAGAHPPQRAWGWEEDLATPPAQRAAASLRMLVRLGFTGGGNALGWRASVPGLFLSVLRGRDARGDDALRDVVTHEVADTLDARGRFRVRAGAALGAVLAGHDETARAWLGAPPEARACSADALLWFVVAAVRVGRSEAAMAAVEAGRADGETAAMARALGDALPR